MISSGKRARWLSAFLIITGVHSILVGLILIINPYDILNIFGLKTENTFFPTQGGIFHLIMSLIYFIAASDIFKHNILIRLSIIIKLIATVYLSVYFAFVEHVMIVMISGIIDFLMALVLIYLNWDFINPERNLKI